MKRLRMVVLTAALVGGFTAATPAPADAAVCRGLNTSEHIWSLIGAGQELYRADHCLADRMIKVRQQALSEANFVLTMLSFVPHGYPVAALNAVYQLEQRRLEECQAAGDYGIEVLSNSWNGQVLLCRPQQWDGIKGPIIPAGAR